MAKIKLGGMVGMVSGSVGGMTYSHNRYGTYTRRRATPTKVTSVYAENAKGRLAVISQSWAGLTAAQRLAWSVWAANNPVTDRLGDRQVLAANAAFMTINGALDAAGATKLVVPPVGAAPAGLLTLVLDADIGAGDFDITYTATPLGAGCKIEIWGCITQNVSQNYVANKLRFLGVTAAAQASPFAVDALFLARFGTPAVGQNAHVRCLVLDTATGLRSGALSASKLVTTT